MRGVSRQAVAAAVKSGRIAEAVLDSGQIDVELADRLWAENTNPSSGEHGHLRNRKSLNDEEVVQAARSVGINPDAPPTLVESKTLQAAYQARLAQIEYEEKIGQLVEIEAIKKEAFQLARITRDAMLAIPDRLSAELAGITDPFEIHQKISTEIRGAISEISKIV